MRAALFVLLCFCFLCVCTGTLDLGELNFERVVLRSSQIWVVLFHSATCEGSQAFKDTWEAFSASLTKIQTAQVEIDENMELARELGVLNDGVPTVRVFHKLKDRRGKAIMRQDIMTTKQLQQALRKVIVRGGGKAPPEDTHGFYVKVRK